MSYVLDALKKSERERQQRQSPHLLSIHASEPSFRKSRNLKKIFFISGLVGLLLTVVTITTYILINPSQEITNETNPSVQPVPPVKTEIVTTLEPKPLISKDKSPVVIPEKTEIAAENPKTPSAENIDKKPDVTEIPLLKNLPPELQKGIPELKMSGHTFSTTPEKRIIIINNNILREGNRIDSLTTLKEITREGVIIDFSGILFRVENN